MNKTLIRFIGAAIVAVLSLEASSLDQLPRIAISVVVGLPAFVFMIMSRRQLGDSFAVRPEAKALVTTGVYSRIQHPMYLFLDLFFAAVIVAFDMTILLWLWGILVIVQILQSRREGAILRSSFGVDYEAYVSQTWF